MSTTIAPPQDPQGDAEWQNAADVAHALLAVDAARAYGLISGGPDVDTDRAVRGGARPRPRDGHSARRGRHRAVREGHRGGGSRGGLVLLARGSVPTGRVPGRSEALSAPLSSRGTRTPGGRAERRTHRHGSPRARIRGAPGGAGASDGGKSAGRGANRP